MDYGPVIERIIAILQTKVSFNVSEVVKGGSLGQGTAIPGKSDLDLVLYSRDISPDYVVKNGVGRYLDELDKVLQSTLQGDYHRENKTPYALQFKLRGLEVDLLPSPCWISAHEYIEYLSRLSHGDRRKLQCSEAKWTKEFFQRQPNELKEYIRKAKIWRDRIWRPGVVLPGKPKSFLLSFLIVEAYRRVGRNDPVAITNKVRRMVRRHRRLRVHWIGRGALYSGRYQGQYDRSGRPYILDPVNPFNNIYESGIQPAGAYNPYSVGGGDWDNMVRHIGSLNLA